MYINLELYRTFYVTAKWGSLTRAAAELYTSQPAVSQSIRQLEDRLGGPLFSRNARGVTLTAEGEVLFRYIEQGYSLIMAGERKFSELKRMSSGQLRIAVCTAVCKYELLESLDQYRELYPGIQINIKDDSSQAIARLLQTGEIDIGILNLRNLDEAQAELIHTIHLQDCFVAGPQYGQLEGKRVSLEQLARNFPLILLQKGGSTREYVEEFFRTRGIELEPRMELSHLDLILEFALRGLGVACVAESYVRRELQSGQLFRLALEEEIPVRSLAVVVKRGMPLSTAAQRFVELFG